MLAATLAAFALWRPGSGASPSELVLFGNVDLRSIELAFNGNERITAMLVEEGNRVRKGDVVARLDTSRLEPRVAQAEAQSDAQRAIVERLRNGSRPEEIAQARANLDQAKADADNAQRQYERKKSLLSKAAVSEQDFDNAKATVDIAVARVRLNERALDLIVAGPRREEIKQAEAQLRADDARLAWLRRERADAQLLAPADAVVRSRLMEPGEMASPQRPVLSLAVLDPKWVRAYVGEPDLGKLRPGARATVEVDSFPSRRFDGWIGFISPTAEFTPKEIQTAELRTSLVYQVRVFVHDPSDDLRLGMPATVRLSLDRDGSARSADMQPARLSP
ncbi:efflux RND transporter periplasmic adaptor subunit [Rhodopseudomonas palustris]|uniref:efflux RND transporter periplasmic adaptor subunit n=1 Tax=Rhodopseudomonas palustris TaxID=1076 RepID=UPI0039F5CD2F